MYQLQERADEVAILDKGRTGDYVIPLATLKDEYGGVSHIIKDDGCFVLINKTVTGGFVMRSELVSRGGGGSGGTHG